MATTFNSNVSQYSKFISDADSGLPFGVDVIDWVKLPESLQKQIKKEHDVVQAAPEN